MCLLGLVDALAPKNVTRTLLTLLFYYARKLENWKKKPTPPTAPALKAHINKALPLYQAMYTSRGIPNKFEKVWGRWTIVYSI